MSAGNLRPFPQRLRKFSQLKEGLWALRRKSNRTPRIIRVFSCISWIALNAGGKTGSTNYTKHMNYTKLLELDF